MPETYLNDMPMMTDELFELFATFIYDFVGIHLGGQKKTLLVSRFQKRLRTLGLNSYEEYFQRVTADQDECTMMINNISTNTTKFFRENHHFELLKESLIPELLESRRASQEIRIWSAGCSTGEEPYSIAISVCEALNHGYSDLDPDPFCGWKIKILATDISTNVLTSAQRGLYGVEQLPTGLNREFLSRYFLKGNGAFQGMVTVKDFLKQAISFRRLNFKDSDYPFSKKFDLIFCRNVIIYFDDEMKSHLFSKIHQHLATDGHLFLGHSETMFNNSLFAPTGITVYRRL